MKSFSQNHQIGKDSDRIHFFIHFFTAIMKCIQFFHVICSGCRQLDWIHTLYCIDCRCIYTISFSQSSLTCISSHFVSVSQDEVLAFIGLLLASFLLNICYLFSWRIYRIPIVNIVTCQNAYNNWSTQGVPQLANHKFAENNTAWRATINLQKNC